MATFKPLASSFSLVLVFVLAAGCERKDSAPGPARTLLIASFEEPLGQATGWGGGTVRKGRATEGLQNYEVVFGDDKSGLISRPGALSPAADSFPKLLFDVRNSTAPFLLYLALSQPGKEPFATFPDVWVPLGDSTLEFNLSAARGAGSDLAKAVVRIGPQKPGVREYTVLIDNVRLSMDGPAAAGAEAAREAEGESLVPQGSFEEGFSGWTPATWGVGRAAFAVVRGPDAFRGGASAGVFHEAGGRAGLVSPVLDLPPGFYRLAAAVRVSGGGRIEVRRREAGVLQGEKDFLAGTIEAAEEWGEKSVEVEVPDSGPAASGEGARPIQLIFTSEEGDLFLDEISLVSRPAAEGGPRSPPHRRDPPAPLTHTVLIFDPVELWEGSLGEVRALAADLSPAVLGGGPGAGALRLAERIKGEAAVRLWFIGSSSDATAWTGDGATLGTTPAEVRAALALLPAGGERQLAVAARPDRPGSLATFADTADVLVGGIPLRAARQSGGVAAFAGSVDSLRKAADLVPPRRPRASRRPIAAWIDVRVKPGELEASPEELRAMVYLALVHRADAAVLAPLAGERDAPKLARELDRIAEELSEAAGDLADLQGVGEIEVTDRRVHVRLGRSGKGYILILASTVAAAVEKFQVRVPAEVSPVPLERSLGPWEGRIERLAGR